MPKHGKKYLAAATRVDVEKSYPLDEAISLTKETNPVKFDATVELHVRLSVDPRQADQQVRGTIALPNGTGKSKRVVAFVSEDKVREAMDAGALEAGADELIAKVEKGWTDFDVAVATPDMMRNMAKLGKILGTKGLMPNPKAGTVTQNVAQTVKEIVAGRIEYRVDPTGIIHTVIGKSSFAAEKLLENAKALLGAVQGARPASIKGTYMMSISLSTSMGPGIKVDPSTI